MAAYQQDTSCSSQRLHGCVEISVAHMGKLLHAAVDEETLEAGHAGPDHGPEFQL